MEETSAPTHVKQQLSDSQQYLNQDTLVHLIAQANEAPLKINSIEYPALIDFGAQMSTVTSAKQLGLPLQQLDHILNTETTGWK